MRNIHLIGICGTAMASLAGMLRAQGHRVTGSDSFILKASVVSMEHLERFLDKLGHYGTTATATVLSSPVLQRAITEKVIEQFHNDK